MGIQSSPDQAGVLGPGSRLTLVHTFMHVLSFIPTRLPGTHIHTCTLLPYPPASLDAQCVSVAEGADSQKDAESHVPMSPPGASVSIPVEVNVSIYQEGRSTGSMTPLGHFERKEWSFWLD